jgi:trimethylamine:corrinoid methyltransferase-like protein
MSPETTSSARISPITIKPEMKIKTLSDQDLAKIHQATLTVLNKTGVRFPSEKALKIFAEAGADVDFKRQTVKIQPDLLMENLAHAPRHFTMGSRGDRDLDVVLDGNKTYCGTAGTGTRTIDPVTGRRRPSTKNDIAMMASMPVLGSTAPASIAGAMVLGNAEILSSVCLLQLANPGTPVFYPLFSAMMNPFTGGILVSTQIQHLFYAGTVQLGHYYNLPVMSSFGGSDLQHPENWSVGKNDAVDAFFVCATGPDMLPSFGLLEAYTLLYPEKLLFDDEIFQAVKTITEGLDMGLIPQFLNPSIWRK